MLVTEGRASRKGRLASLVTAIVLAAVTPALFIFLPLLGRLFVGVGVVIAAGTVLRLAGFSVVARFLKTPVAPESARRPAFAFLIPCLNELPSLRQTVPALRKLDYAGTLLFYYVCETASTDGTIEYLRESARKDARVVLLEKSTAPSGRGAPIQYGLDHAPPCDVVGFLDADHILRQDSLDELARVFGAESGPDAVQGVCRTGQEQPNWLARLLTVEREWLEGVELQATSRLGGLCNVGGGQGFLKRNLFDDPGLRIDESMILDDTDLSCRLALKGHHVVFNPRVATYSHEPEALSEFVDQRYRWARGWVQLFPKCLAGLFSTARVPLGLRCDMFRFALTPLAMIWLCLAFAAGLTALFTTHGASPWPALASLLWPFLLGPVPYLANAGPSRRRDAALVLLGIPLLIYAYCLFATVSAVDQYILLRPVCYAKTVKPE